MTEGGFSPLPREARPYQGRPAGLVTRGVAAALDGVVVALVLAVGYAALAGVRFLLDPLRFTWPQPSWLLNLTTAFVVLVLYLAVAWSVSGRTYGSLVMGLRVLGAHGGRPRPAQALLRAAACAVFPVGLLWCVVGPGHRSVQDVLLRTSVVYDWQPHQTHHDADDGADTGTEGADEASG
jgi:uncharacterized RDD family membrane protein YckC